MIPNRSELDQLIDNDAEQADKFLQTQSGKPQRLSWRWVLIACFVGLGVFACALGTFQATTSPSMHNQPNEATNLIEVGNEQYGAEPYGIEQYVRILWEPHPYKCMEVKSGTSHKYGIVYIWDCENIDSEIFITPQFGATGPIKWAKHPELCLDAPGGSQLQFWQCQNTPDNNMQFIMPEKGQGTIRLATTHPNKCVDVPDNNDQNGNWLQIWDCDARNRTGKDMDFLIIPATNATGIGMAAISFLVQNLNYDQLTTNQPALAQFEMTVKDAISSAIGNGTSSDQVALRTSEGSVNVDAIVTLAEGVNGDLKAKLQSSDLLSLTLMQKLNALPQLVPMCEGPIAICIGKIVVSGFTNNRSVTPSSAVVNSKTMHILITTACLLFSLGSFSFDERPSI